MPYKVYKTPNPQQPFDTSHPYEKGIDDLLLTFNYPSAEENSVSRIVTVPWKEYVSINGGWKITACQLFQHVYGWRSFVFDPAKDKIYEFREALVSARSAGERFLRAGITGLLFGAEKKGIISRALHDPETFTRLSSDNASLADWYHFAETPEELLAELHKKCALILP